MDIPSEATKLPISTAKPRLKTPKGTRDFICSGTEMELREHIFQILIDVFACHGGQELETPIFELKENLTGKYGEDTELVYDLKDQGGELCSLRYDLTVPFARWLAMNSNYSQVSLYQIGKVFRRDQPVISRGTYREFYQCDFDIAGNYEPMIADAEILLIIVEAFEALQIDVDIRINHTRILDGILAALGVPGDKIRSIRSSVEKRDLWQHNWDDFDWDEVRKEIVEQNGLPKSVADCVDEIVLDPGSFAHVLEVLESYEELAANEDVKAVKDDMTLLLTYLEAYGIADKFSFDLNLSRGFDYYTGFIFEVVPRLRNAEGIRMKDVPPVGSIAAGGRYDKLVGTYCNRDVPCVGVSFGVERIYTLLNARGSKKKVESVIAQEFDVYVVAVGGDGLLLERMAICGQLTRAGIRAGFLRKTKPSLRSQFNAADKVPLTVILGPDELAAGNVRLKASMGKESEIGSQGKDEKDRGELVARDDLVVQVKKMLQGISGDIKPGH